MSDLPPVSRKQAKQIMDMCDQAIVALEQMMKGVADLEVKIKMVEHRCEALTINAARVEDRLTVLEHANKQEALNKGRNLQAVKIGGNSD